MKTKSILTAEDTAKMMRACKEEAVKNAWKVAIAIVDDGGYLLHLERIDGAPVQSPEIARQKAFTSAVSRMPTKLLEDMAKDRPGMLRMPDRLPLQGGIPLMHEGHCIGAIGVSGVKSHEDEQVAIAGRVALLGE